MLQDHKSDLPNVRLYKVAATQKPHTYRLVLLVSSIIFLVVFTGHNAGTAQDLKCGDFIKVERFDKPSQSGYLQGTSFLSDGTLKIILWDKPVSREVIVRPAGNFVIKVKRYSSDESVFRGIKIGGFIGLAAIGIHNIFRGEIYDNNFEMVATSMGVVLIGAAIGGIVVRLMIPRYEEVKFYDVPTNLNCWTVGYTYSHEPCIGLMITFSL